MFSIFEACAKARCKPHTHTHTHAETHAQAQVCTQRAALSNNSVEMKPPVHRGQSLQIHICEETLKKTLIVLKTLNVGIDRTTDRNVFVFFLAYGMK